MYRLVQNFLFMMGVVSGITLALFLSIFLGATLYATTFVAVEKLYELSEDSSESEVMEQE